MARHLTGVFLCSHSSLGKPKPGGQFMLFATALKRPAVFYCMDESLKGSDCSDVSLRALIAAITDWGEYRQNINKLDDRQCLRPVELSYIHQRYSVNVVNIINILN